VELFTSQSATRRPDRDQPRSTLLVHAYGHEVTGLKTYRGAKRKEQLGVCSIPGFFYSPALSFN
jgi:hypothetical protein